MKKTISKLAALALVVLGLGVDAAAIGTSGRFLGPNSVKETDLRTDSVTNDKLAPGAVSTDTVEGVMPVSKGGTGATDAGTARTNLSAAQSGANADITSLSAVTAIPAAAISAGNLGPSVIASSVGAGSITNLQTAAGTFSNISIPAANVNAGLLGASVQASSLNATGVSPATYGSATLVPVFTLGVDGRISAVTNTAVLASEGATFTGPTKSFSGSVAVGSTLTVVNSSTQIYAHGYSAYGGANTSHGLIQIGDQGRIDYDQFTFSDLSIDNLNDVDTADIRFRVRASNAATVKNPLSLLGTGVAEFNNTTSSQVVAKGFSADGGASAGNGMMKLGSSNISGLRLQNNDVTGDAFIENMDAAALRFCVGSATTRVCPMKVTGPGFPTFDSATSTQALFTGFSADGGNNGANGMIKLGSALNSGLRLQNNQTTGDVFIENMDAASMKLCVNSAQAVGGRVCALTMAGTGVITLSSQTLFTNATSTQAVFKGFSPRGGANASAGSVMVGGSDGASGRMSYDSAVSNDFYIENMTNAPSADIRFFVLGSNASPVESMALRGDQSVAVLPSGSASATPFKVGATSMTFDSNGNLSILGSITTENGVSKFKNTVSTQAVFYGYSNDADGPSATVNSGQIKLGDEPSGLSGFLSFSNAGHHVELTNGHDGVIRLCTNAALSRTCSLTVAQSGIVTISSQALFTANTSSQAVFSGRSFYSGNATANGSVQIGGTFINAGRLDYDAIFRMDNTIETDGIQHEFNTGTSVALTKATPLRLMGTGEVRVMPIGGRAATSFSVGSTMTLSSNGTLSVVGVSTQGVFSGFSSDGGANSQSGQILLGDSADGLRIQKRQSGSGEALIETTLSRGIRICTNSSGTRLCPIKADVSGFAEFRSDTSTAAIIKGWSAFSGASVNNGLFVLGEADANAFTLDKDQSGNAARIDYRTDSDTAVMEFGMRGSGTRIVPLKIIGTGAVQAPTLSSPTTFLSSVTARAEVGLNANGGGGLRVSSGPTTGALVSGILSATASLDFAAITPATTAGYEDLTMTVNGAHDGDSCFLGVPNALASTAGLTFSCWVSASNTVTVRASCNDGETAGVADACANPAAATVRATVIKN